MCPGLFAHVFEMSAWAQPVDLTVGNANEVTIGNADIESSLCQVDKVPNAARWYISTIHVRAHLSLPKFEWVSFLIFCKDDDDTSLFCARKSLHERSA